MVGEKKCANGMFLTIFHNIILGQSYGYVLYSSDIDVSKDRPSVNISGT